MKGIGEGVPLTSLLAETRRGAAEGGGEKRS